MQKRCCKGFISVLITFDFVTIIWMFIDLIPGFRETNSIVVVGLVFVTYRLYRIVVYFCKYPCHVFQGDGVAISRVNYFML